MTMSTFHSEMESGTKLPEPMSDTVSNLCWKDLVYKTTYVVVSSTGFPRNETG